MKQKLAILILTALAAGMLAGCGGETTVTEKMVTETAVTETQVTAAEKVTVSNVDELLAAIGSHREICLEAGAYHLCDATNFGADSGSDSYFWRETADGFELVVRDVQDLTIRGTGMETTTLETLPRFSNILVLENCDNVVLEDFTAGHTQEEGVCAGGVLVMTGCNGVELNRLGLFGCGTTGVWSQECTDVRIIGSDIYECSVNGILADQTDGLTVENCKIRNLGGSQYGGNAFWLTGSRNVLVSNCQVTDNRVSCLINCDPSEKKEACDNVVFRNVTFTGNDVEDSVFAGFGGGLVWDECSFEKNVIDQWFNREGCTVLDGVGKSWTEGMLDRLHYPPAETIAYEEGAQIHVSTVDEFLAAIGPNREIILEGEFYDLSQAKGYGTKVTDYYFWSEAYDGPELVITGAENLTIRSESGDVSKCTISAVPRYANVLTFQWCTNVVLSGFTAGHTEEEGTCCGGVLYFRDSDNILVENCGLFGCGILGIQADLCGNITVKDSEIYECSYGGIRMADVNGVTIKNCTFRDLGGSSMEFFSCRNVSVNGKSVAGNAVID